MLHADPRPAPHLEPRLALKKSLLLHVLVLGSVVALPYFHKPPEVVETPSIQAMLVRQPVAEQPRPRPVAPPPLPEPIDVPEPVTEPPKVALPKVKPPEKPVPKVAEKSSVPILRKEALRPVPMDDEMRALRQEMQQADFKQEMDKSIRQAQTSQDPALLARYQQDIRNKVYQKANFPPGSEGRTVQVRIAILPGGEVANVYIVKSSGDLNIDAIVKAAVQAASPLPVPEDPRLFNNFRSGIFVFTVK